MAKTSLVHAHDGVHWFVEELGSRVVAQSGTPTDIHHLGKLILQALGDAPEFIHQIDGATDRHDTNASVLERSIRCAVAFRKLGLMHGDVITIMAPNHLDVAIPFYAALYLGVIIAAVDVNLGVLELKTSFSVNKPKMVLCQSEMTSRVAEALKDSQVDATVITFDQCEGFLQFHQLLESDGGDNTSVREFKPNDFDPAETIAVITSTSGTTGVPKGAALTHKNLRIAIAYNWLGFTNFPTPTRLFLILSPLQWLSAVFSFIYSPILRYTRLQSSKPASKDDIYFLINKYRPTMMFLTPFLANSLFNGDGADSCDFSCVEDIGLGGSIIPQAVVDNVKKAVPNARVSTYYGLSEAGGFCLYDPFPPKMSMGRPIGSLSYRLVNIETLEDINEPNVPGELWLKGPTTFKGYFNNPAATAQTYEDGWLKTGDILYRDEHWNFYYADRLKELLKYKNHQVSPTELESVIRQHPGVLDVAVTGIPDPECGDLPVACVIRKPGNNVTAQEIKDLIKETLSDSKQLRGGVAFVTQLPMTATTKICRRKLKELIPSLTRE